MSSYTLKILPTSKPTSQDWLNYILIALNYFLHIVLISFQQFCYFKVGFSDAGYYKTHYVSKLIGDIELPRDQLENPESAEVAAPVIRQKYEIYPKEEYVKYE